MSERSARAVVEELLHRQRAGGELDIGDLVAAECMRTARDPGNSCGHRRQEHSLHHEIRRHLCIVAVACWKPPIVRHICGGNNSHGLVT